MIETQFFILGNQEYQEAKQDADELGISVDMVLNVCCNLITKQLEWVIQGSTESYPAWMIRKVIG